MKQKIKHRGDICVYTLYIIFIVSLPVPTTNQQIKEYRLRNPKEEENRKQKRNIKSLTEPNTTHKFYIYYKMKLIRFLGCCCCFFFLILIIIILISYILNFLFVAATL